MEWVFSSVLGSIRTTIGLVELVVLSLETITTYILWPSCVMVSSGLKLALPYCVNAIGYTISALRPAVSGIMYGLKITVSNVLRPILSTMLSGIVYISPHGAKAIMSLMSGVATVVVWVCQCIWRILGSITLRIIPHFICPEQATYANESQNLLCSTSIFAGQLFLTMILMCLVVGGAFHASKFHPVLRVLRPVHIVPFIFSGLIINFINDYTTENDGWSELCGGLLALWFVVYILVMQMEKTSAARQGELLGAIRERNTVHRASSSSASRATSGVNMPASTSTEQTLRRRKPPNTQTESIPRSKFWSSTCAICLEDFSPETCTEFGESTTLPCGHNFHRNCSKEWISVSPSCPVCRQRVDSRGRLVQALFT